MNKHPFKVLIEILEDGNRYYIKSTESNEILIECKSEDIANALCQSWNLLGVTWRKDGTLVYPD